MEDISKRIENIFRYSGSSNELFDAFQKALQEKIKDLDLFKILLANPALSGDELKMYSEKLSKEFSNSAYDIFLWTAGIFECRPGNYNIIDNSLKYYKKASELNSESPEPYLKLLKLYNFDLNVPSNERILKIVIDGIPKVRVKSKVYYALADLYKKLGDDANRKRYLGLAEKSTKTEE